MTDMPESADAEDVFLRFHYYREQRAYVDVGPFPRGPDEDGGDAALAAAEGIAALLDLDSRDDTSDDRGEVSFLEEIDPNDPCPKTGCGCALHDHEEGLSGPCPQIAGGRFYTGTASRYVRETATARVWVPDGEGVEEARTLMLDTLDDLQWSADHGTEPDEQHVHSIKLEGPA